MAAICLARTKEGRASFVGDESDFGEAFRVRLEEPLEKEDKFYCAQVDFDGQGRQVWIHKKSFARNTGMNVERVFSNWEEQCASANRKLGQLRLNPLLTEELEALPWHEQRIIVSSLNALPEDVQGHFSRKEIWRPSGALFARRVTFDREQSYLYIHRNRTAWGDEEIGKGNFYGIDEGYLLFQDGRIRKIAISTMRLEGLPENGQRLSEESREVLKIVQSLARTPGVPRVYGQMVYFGKKDREGRICAEGGGDLKHTIFMDRYEGDLLTVFEERRDLLSEEIRQKQILQLLTGMAAFHGKGVVHRDIKPENIMFDEERNVYFIDFGFSARRGHVHGLAGTPGYTAPEAKSGEYEEAQDIFSLGIVFAQYYLREFHIAQDIFPQKPRSLGMSRKYARWCIDQLAQLMREEKLDPRIFDIISRMLSLDPTQRPSAVKALAEFSDIFNPAAEVEIDEFTAI